MLKTLTFRRIALLSKEFDLVPDELNVETLSGHIYEKYFKLKFSERDPETTPLCRHILCDNNRTNQARVIPPNKDDIWIFGYGSLVWKADFPYIDRRRGYICSFQRRFYQNSIDHRGTLSQPGRVVTLMHTDTPDDRVYGVAYRIASKQKQKVLDHLDYREKNGYERCTLKFQEFPETKGKQFPVIMYIATMDNASFAGDVWELNRIADQIFTSAGPSGPNREYLFNLANAMRELFPGVQDEHLFSLEREVRSRINRDESKILERALRKEIFAIVSHGKPDDDIQENVRQLESLKAFCSKTGWKEALLSKELFHSNLPDS